MFNITNSKCYHISIIKKLNKSGAGQSNGTIYTKSINSGVSSDLYCVCCTTI